MSVYRRSDVRPSSPSGLQVREGAEPLYEQPLGSEASVREFWSIPAATIGLPLLASLYNEGFYRGVFWESQQLGQAMAELARLESHWEKTMLDPATHLDLRERAGWVHIALNVAESCGGWVSIG